MVSSPITSFLDEQIVQQPSSVSADDVKHPTARVHIIGASGSGKTTLGRALAGELRCVHFDSDDFYWLPTDPPYQEKRPVDERWRMLGDAVRGAEAWVLSGGVESWGDHRILLCDLVVFLWLPKEVRIERLWSREIARYGLAAVSPGGTRREAAEEFMAWAAAYDDSDSTVQSRRRHEDWLGKLPCPILRLDGELTTIAQVQTVVSLICDKRTDRA